MLLPLSLLSSALLLSSLAHPVASAAVELTSTTFTKTLEQGQWFIEFYSPYCGHCRQFKPTWETLVRDSEKEFPEVGLGTVNCVLHADLCDQQGITGYPSLFMYKDGKKLENFKSGRDVDNLKAFIRKHIPTTSTTLSNEPTTSSSPPLKHQQLQRPKPSFNPDGEVISLTSDNFYQTLTRGNAFVKFYAPWCGHCKKLAPTWRQLAKHMQGKATVAEVNCDEHQGLCTESGVQGYPTLAWYGGEVEKERLEKHEYSGSRKLEQLKAFVEKAISAGVQVLANEQDIFEQIAKQDVVYLLLHRPENQDILEFVRDAAKPLLGTPPIFASSSPALFTNFSISDSVSWEIIAIKDNDAKIPASTLHGTISSSSIPSNNDVRTWLLSHRLPTSLELTQDTFQSVMNAPHSPLVVIFAVSTGQKEKVEERLKEVGKKWRVRTGGSGVVNGRDVVWTMMDKTRWGQWLKSMYSVPQKDSGDEDGFGDVKVIIADHRKLIYYDADRTGNPLDIMSSSDLFSAVEDATSGKLRYKNSENFVERLARQLNNKLTAIQDVVSLHPVKSVFIVVGGMVLFVYLLHRLMDGPRVGLEVKRDGKPNKNARLD